MLNHSVFFALRCFLIIWLTSLSTTAVQGQSMPSLAFSTTDGVLLTPEDIPENSALLLAYFRTDCDYCRFTARKIKEQVTGYPLEVWMVSPEAQDLLSVFEEMNGLYGLPNLTVAQDHTKNMHQWFQFEEIPYYLLFNKNGKQMASFKEWPALAEVKKLLVAP